jgi:hypothetical protein
MSKEPMVFLSYAREDQKDAKKIFEDLRNHGVNIWADFDALRPGSKWEIEIKRAIKESRYFLAVLSSNSVSKRGHVQKEMSLALNILDEFPEKGIYIIPIRLNECSPSHEKLKELHWVDIFLSWNDGIDRILSVVAPVTEKSDHKVSDIKQTADEEEVDNNLILSYENTRKENTRKILLKNEKETPYLESKVINDSVECVIYADVFIQFLEKAYFLETTIMDVTIDELKEIIKYYYSIFQHHYFSAFGINQQTYSWFGYGPSNFIKTLEMQYFRYSPLRENNDYIHHREISCFIDELDEAIFYIHSQPNRKDEPDELITLDYVNIGFLFNNIPFNHIYHRFFEKINSIPDVVMEVNQALTVSKRIDYEFEKEGSIITNPDERLGGGVCGIYGDNSNDINITEIYNDKIMVNIGQYHEIKDKCKYKILSVTATTLPAGNFKATIVNYRGDWGII